jgi:hypothetical protein
LTHTRINKIFEKATRKALVGWESEIDSLELCNELWVWYLESPYVQKRFEELSEAKLVSFARRQAINILSKEAKDRDLFQHRTIYSSDSVKAALASKSKNGYLESILPFAMDALGSKNAGYAEAIRSRYEDGHVPEDKSGQNRLFRAHKALTEHVNIIALTAGDGNGKPKLRNPVDPNNRSQGGVHSDPTANIALMLIDNPELRDEVLFELTMDQFIKGKGNV